MTLICGLAIISFCISFGALDPFGAMCDVLLAISVKIPDLGEIYGI